MPTKLRYCSRCKERTVQDGVDHALRCTQCAIHPKSEKQTLEGERFDGGLVSALRLCRTYPRAANCFFVHALKIALKVFLFVTVFSKVLEQGFFVSAAVVAVGFFAIDCFGPRGREKVMASEFGARFWTTLIKRYNEK